MSVQKFFKPAFLYLLLVPLLSWFVPTVPNLASTFLIVMCLMVVIFFKWNWQDFETLTNIWSLFFSIVVIATNSKIPLLLVVLITLSTLNILQRCNARNIFVWLLLCISFLQFPHNGILLLVDILGLTTLYIIGVFWKKEFVWKWQKFLFLALSIVIAVYGIIRFPSKFAMPISLIMALVVSLAFLLVLGSAMAGIYKHIYFNSFLLYTIWISCIFVLSLLFLHTDDARVISTLFISIAEFISFGLKSMYNRKPVKDNLISILIPVYNDSDTLSETLDSIVAQDYSEYEVVLMNDGSTDDSEQKILEYIDKNKLGSVFHYYSHENTDQLLAIKEAATYAHGEVIYILHSDDRFCDSTVLRRANFALQDPDIEGILINMLIQNDNSNITGKQDYIDLYWNKTTIIRPALYFGRNLFPDFSFWRREVFNQAVTFNYLTNNTPPWMDLIENIRPLRLVRPDFYTIAYRIGSNNYMNNPLGVLNVLNGELRTLVLVLSHFDIVQYFCQNYLFRVARKLHLTSIYFPVYRRRSTTKLKMCNIVQTVVKLRVPDYKDNMYLDSLIKFYQSSKHRTLYFDSKTTFPTFSGASVKAFNKSLLNDDLPDFYVRFMGEMKDGFDKIVVQSDEVKKYEKLLDFMNIRPFVEIINSSEES